MNKITIVVPIYNIDTKHLKQCINSLLNQTLKEIEIILVDDGSTSDNALICDQYSNLESRIKVIHKKNKGVSSARNEGIKQSTTDYIMFVDGDDWLDAECCEKVYNYIIQNPKIELVCYSYYKNYSDREEKINIFSSKKLIDCKKKETNYYDMKILGSTCMKLYSKKIFAEKYFNEDLVNGEDVEFNFRIFKNIGYIFGTNENFYHYRIQDSSSVRKYNEHMISNYEETLKSMKSNLNNDNNEMRINAYYSFGAISYLMICMNAIFTKENKKTYIQKVRQLKELSKKANYREILRNSNRVKLPFTRKLPLILAKYHMYCGLNLMIKVKKILMSR